MLYLLSITTQQGKSITNTTKWITFIGNIRAGSLKTEQVDAMT